MQGPPLPMGYTFNPKQDTILYFLTTKHSDPTYNATFVGERPLYAPDAAWDFGKDFATYTAGDDLHFFTPLENGSPDEDRVVGNGSWKFECTYEIYKEENQVIAFQKVFTFCDTNDLPTGLVMYEYTLAEEQAWALCRIRRLNSAVTNSLNSASRVPVTYIPSAATLKRQRLARRGHGQH